MEPPEFGDLESKSAAPPLGRRPAKEFPPPISWLAIAEDLPSHVPWEMKKYCTSDGRLIIKEERAKRHDYFLANRSNGRLVLNLVHVDESDVVEEEGNENENENEECGDAAEEKQRDPDTDGELHSTVEEEASECYNYSGVGLNFKPCASGAFVATAPLFMPPLHI